MRDRLSAGAVRLLIDHAGVGGSAALIDVESAETDGPFTLNAEAHVQLAGAAPPGMLAATTAPSPRCPLPAPDGRARSTLYTAARPPLLPSPGYAPRCCAPARWPPSSARAWDKPSLPWWPMTSRESASPGFARERRSASTAWRAGPARLRKTATAGCPAQPGDVQNEFRDAGFNQSNEIDMSRFNAQEVAYLEGQGQERLYVRHSQGQPAGGVGGRRRAG